MNLNIGAGRFKKECWLNIDHASGHYHKNKIDIDIDFFNFDFFDIDSNSIDNIYCSHVIEHLPDQIVEKIFSECYRILKSDGVFRVTCPDAKAAYSALKYNKIDFFRIYLESPVFNEVESMKRYNLINQLKFASIEQLFIYLINPQQYVFNDYDNDKITDVILKYCFNSMKYKDFLNFIIEKINMECRNKNPWQHINWWDADKIQGLLKKIGFKKIYESGYQKSFSLEMKDINFFDKSLPEISVYMECIR